MWCSLCNKFATKACFKKTLLIKKMSPACVQFVFNTRKISTKTLKVAMGLSGMPKTQIMALTALLDAGLRLRPQGLSLGISTNYQMKGEVNELFKVFLISAAKGENDAIGVAFVKDSRRKPVSILLPKSNFLKAKDQKLKSLWHTLEAVCMRIDNQNRKKFLVLKVVKRLRRDYLQRMIDLQKINIRVKGRKAQEVARALSSYL